VASAGRIRGGHPQGGNKGNGHSLMLLAQFLATTAQGTQQNDAQNCTVDQPVTNDPVGFPEPQETP
jgi:hypothetical protein